jgi:hypothetical protein
VVIENCENFDLRLSTRGRQAHSGVLRYCKLRDAAGHGRPEFPNVLSLHNAIDIFDDELYLCTFS